MNSENNDTGVRYCADSGSLYVDGECRRLRPKARLLLEFLMNRQRQIVRRDELLMAVWGHLHVSDHTLHQTISELRRLMGEYQCIRTIPNRGYQWMPLTANRQQRRPAPARHSLAAAAFIAVALALTLLVDSAPQSDASDPAVITGSPAMMAFIAGITHAKNGDYDTAIAQLESSLQHDPGFSRAKLELARTLLIAGRQQHALTVATEALSESRIQSDVYGEAAASQLISKAQWLQGDLLLSLSSTNRALDLAKQVGQACMVLEARLWERYIIAWIDHVNTDGAPPTQLASVPATIDECDRQLDRIEASETQAG